MVSMTVGH